MRELLYIDLQVSLRGYHVKLGISTRGISQLLPSYNDADRIYYVDWWIFWATWWNDRPRYSIKARV